MPAVLIPVASKVVAPEAVTSLWSAHWPDGGALGAAVRVSWEWCWLMRLRAAWSCQTWRVLLSGMLSLCASVLYLTDEELFYVATTACMFTSTCALADSWSWCATPVWLQVVGIWTCGSWLRTPCGFRCLCSCAEAICTRGESTLDITNELEGLLAKLSLAWPRFFLAEESSQDSGVPCSRSTRVERGS